MSVIIERKKLKRVFKKAAHGGGFTELNPVAASAFYDSPADH